MPKITVMVDTGVPEQLTKPSVPSKTIEEEVRDSLQLIESGHDSGIEFRAIKGLYDKLCGMKQSDRIQNLRKMIKPVMDKYGYFK